MKICITLAGMLLGVSAEAAKAGPPSPGEALFIKHCASCHGRDGRLGLNGAHNLTKSNLNAYGRGYLVLNGLGKMPAFKQKLSPQVIEQIVLYSMTLK